MEFPVHCSQLHSFADRSLKIGRRPALITTLAIGNCICICLWYCVGRNQLGLVALTLTPLYKSIQMMKAEGRKVGWNLLLLDFLLGPGGAWFSALWLSGLDATYKQRTEASMNDEQ